MQLVNQIFSIQTPSEFDRLALEVYRFQREHVPVYKQFVDLLGKPEPQTVSEIPFLPISFFKTHAIIAGGMQSQTVFKSSGTTGMERSQHLVADVSLYERSFLPTYAHFIGPLENQLIFALLPNYIEQGESSLVYMVDHLIHATNHELSGFYLNNPESLLNAIELGRKTGRKLVLFGVSYALLDLAEQHVDLSDVQIIETGGMKGRRKEMTKEALHAELKQAFGCEFISSEYGMSELLSQAYSGKNGLFDLPPWMDVLLRDVNDPFSLVDEGKTGGVNVIDLANLYSCAFIATQDLGKIVNGQLQLMGRFDQADLRGCNLLVQ
ncbi:MAG: acyl transferase [Candidatus Fluviicola riflensis]|nr:MAG: acyl transferase [Candidatus Fluviicola riflensis]OGS77401.1 MAG: acyl transferase [Candidatus Fluviicola riflensis]OGS83981.1 MAG: acyl transferase [Fluviicola sp. RIFCSPHIGHO2_12_FULL_43_24]OGS84468.1 MAG: acyl transferase [Fluviicola sp. RIFCSPHIGHO2_01_FULL_43_53]